MTTKRPALTGAHYESPSALLPSNRRRGHPFQGHRLVLGGLLWVLPTGAPSQDLPERFGPCKAAHGRFSRRRKSGLWDRLLFVAMLKIAMTLWLLKKEL